MRAGQQRERRGGGGVPYEKISIIFLLIGPAHKSRVTYSTSVKIKQKSVIKTDSIHTPPPALGKPVDHEKSLLGFHR